jgi:hypothetical protein
MMLLEGDEGPSASSGGTDGVPEGSTIMDLQVPPEVLAAAGQQGKPATPAKKEEGDTRSAAASILEKMMRRPRTS